MPVDVGKGALRVGADRVTWPASALVSSVVVLGGNYRDPVYNHQRCTVTEVNGSVDISDK